jgi:hypothetical protein
MLLVSVAQNIANILKQLGEATGNVGAGETADEEATKAFGLTLEEFKRETKVIQEKASTVAYVTPKFANGPLSGLLGADNNMNGEAWPVGAPDQRTMTDDEVKEAVWNKYANEGAKGEVTGYSDDEQSDDPNSPNYRYKDTGYIADSRKEKAANMIYTAKKTGQSLRATDVDWDAIEQNPRQAAELVTKGNLFGKTDWQKLQDAGMEPGAGFLIDKIYASIAPEPSESTPLARKDYAIGLESIRSRLEPVKTVDEVMTVLSDIRGEIGGVQLTADQADKVAKLREEYNQKREIARAADAERGAIFKAWQTAQNERDSVKYEQEKRNRRKWKPDPELFKRIEELSVIAENANKAYTDYLAAHPERQGAILVSQSQVDELWGKEK